MSNLNETCAGLIVVMSMISLGHAGLHTYKFDKWRCLVPRRREWFRVLLTWMLILANVGLFVWGLGWSIVKYNLGWVILPDYGAIPTPYPMFPGKYSKVNIPLTISMNIAYSLQASLNAEEGLYWFHLMRAVRQPKSARNWLNSNYFYAWIVISLFIAFVQCGVGYIRSDGNQVLALAKELTCGGVVELFVLLCASWVLLKFPAFLKDVKASGAGPDVRARLHFYHEANKVRTFFRAVFTVTLLILGIDGCTPEMRVNNTHMASDLIIMVCLGSFFIVLMVSMTLYLPRTYNTLPRSGQVMIGQAQPAHGRNAQDMQLTSGHALMSLLREGGQWDDDDDLRAGITTANGTQSQHNLEVGGPFDSTPKNWSLSSGQLSKEDKWEEDVEAQRPELPSVLEHFTSPISVQRAEVSSGPLRIHIQREVHQDRA